MTSTSQTIISLGSNTGGAWGTPVETLDRAIALLRARFGPPLKVSSRLRSKPVGISRQADFLNQIVVFPASASPALYIRFFKRLEGAAGRRSGTSRRWGPRPLDIDLIDCGGRRIGWRQSASARRPGRAPVSLILPHPQAHLRAFVLVPLLQVVPHWTHPVLGLGGQRLLHRLPLADRRSLRALPPGLDPAAPTCDCR